MVAAMNNKQIEIDSETSRIRAALVNSGRHTFSEAEHKLAESRLSIVIGEQAAGTFAGQAAFLTAVVTGARCFGEVSVHGSIDERLLLLPPLRVTSLAQAAVVLGAREIGAPLFDNRILVGSGYESGNGFSVQAFWNGWSVGVAPGKKPTANGRGDCALAGVAAGALAVGQAFLAEQGDPRAGRMSHCVSLWTPELGEKGASRAGPPSKQVHLPTALWLIGLGNLGQAYLWSLTMLPYPQPKDVILFLQDDELIGKENWGTSVLVQRGRYEILKTRVAEEWATDRGFQVRRIDRRLDAYLLRLESEPGIALAGLDSMTPRCLLGRPGFEYVIDSGLGATVSDYQRFRMNVFDSATNPADHFKGVEDQTAQVVQTLMKLPAYQEIVRTGDDGGCGAAMLAQRSVAVPFVSAFVGALAVTQAIRIASGEARHTGLTGDVCDLRNVRAALGHPPKRINIANALAAF